MQSQRFLSVKEVQAVVALSNARIGKIAAAELNLSQPALSRLIGSVQRKLGQALFETGWTGSIPTPMGELVSEKCQIILEQLRRSEDRLRDLGAPMVHRLTRLRWDHFEVVSLVAERESASSAAGALSRSQSSISQMLRDVQHAIGAPVFTRVAHGLRPNAQTKELVRAWERVRPLLRDLPNQVKATSGQAGGRIAVGMLPFSGQHLVARTFGEIVKTHPNARLRSLTGPYPVLCTMLRDRQIDMIMGTLRGRDCPRDLIEIPLYDEQFTLVARQDHPCFRHGVSLQELARYSWIVGPSGTPIRRYFEFLFETRGTEPPTRISEVLAFADAEETIAHSNSIGVMSYADTALEALRGDLAIVPDGELRQIARIGLTFLRDHETKPDSVIFRHCLEQVLRLSGFVVPRPNVGHPA